MIDTTQDSAVCRTSESEADAQPVRIRSKTSRRSRAQRNLGLECLCSCCPADLDAARPISGSRRSGAVVPAISGGPRSQFHVIARLDAGDSVADVFSRDLFDVTSGIGHTADWPRSLPVRQGTAVGLDELDQTLAAAGYQRSTSWRERVTTRGVVRYFADATTPSRTHRQPR